MKVEDLTLKQIKEICDKRPKADEVVPKCKGCPILTDDGFCLASSPIFLMTSEDLEREVRDDQRTY